MTSTACVARGTSVTAVHPCCCDRTRTFVVTWTCVSVRLFHRDILFHVVPAAQTQRCARAAASSAPKCDVFCDVAQNTKTFQK